MGTMRLLHEEQLSASDDQSILADEELGRIGLSCHIAMDCLCAEL